MQPCNRKYFRGAVAGGALGPAPRPAVNAASLARPDSSPQLNAAVLLKALPGDVKRLAENAAVLAPLRLLAAINLNNKKHKADHLTHSIRAFENARQLSSDYSFTDNTRAKEAYAKFFASKADPRSSYTFRDLVCIGALLHDVGVAAMTEDEGHNPVPVVRFDPKQKALTAKGHEAAGVPIANDICKRLGLSDAEAAYVSSLVAHHMDAKWIKSPLDDRSVISFLRKTNFDLGTAFLVFCDTLALDVPHNKDLYSHMIDYQFTIHIPFSVIGNLSLLEKIETAGAAHKIIFLVFGGRPDQLRSHLFNEHLSALGRLKDLFEAERAELTLDQEEEVRLAETHIRNISREIDRIKADPDCLNKRLAAAASRVAIVDSMQSAERSYDFARFKDELPMLLF